MRGDDPCARDTVLELYVMPPSRRHASALFAALLVASRATRVECRSSDRLHSSLLFELARDVNADTILLEHHAITDLVLPGATFRARRPSDDVLAHEAEPVGDFVVRRGVGSFLVQGAIRACFLAGRVPAARSGLGNAASRATLTKAGLRMSGFVLAGHVPRG